MKMEKREWQHEFVKKYNGNGILEGFSGTGKTYASIMLIKKRKYRQVVVGVPTSYLRTQWYDEFLKHGIEYPEYYPLVETFLTLSNCYLECDLFIVDECHRAAFAPVFKTIFNKVKTQNILGLTATVNDEIKKTIGDTILTIPLEKANISNFKVVFHSIQLTSAERMEYEKITRDIGRCYGMSKRKPGLLNVMKILRYKRRGVVYNAGGRIKLAHELIDANKDKTTLVICKRIAQADTLSMLTGIPTFHGKNLNYSALKAFKEDKISALISVGMLTEGFNKQNIQCLIIVSTATTKEHHVQTIGRAVRLPDEATIHILLAMDTTDEYLLGFREMYDHSINGKFTRLEKKENKQ